MSEPAGDGSRGLAAEHIELPYSESGSRTGLQVNGATEGPTNTRIEGANAINGWVSHETGYVPGPDVIETASVSTNSMGADHGLATGR